MIPSDNQSHRLVYIDVANVVACLSVVILHCNGIFWRCPTGRLWYTSNLIETLFYWAVPIFFMISGITLIDYRDRYSTGTYFKKRFKHVFIPFLFWSFVSVAHGSSVNYWGKDDIFTILINIFNAKYLHLYWFFIPLFSAYLIIPLLAAVRKELKVKVFSYLAIISFILDVAQPTIFHLLHLETNGQLRVMYGYTIYLLLGYVIANTNIPFKWRLLIYSGGIGGWAIQYLGTSVLYLASDQSQIISTFKGYLNFPAVMQAVGMMTFFRYINWENLFGIRGKKVFRNISKYTFGVYLIHYYIMSHISAYFNINTASIIWRSAGALFVFTVSMLICYIISKIPLVKHFIGIN